eukprot:10408363-Lingulodinium_polyedra.AAC.1
MTSRLAQSCSGSPPRRTSRGDYYLPSSGLAQLQTSGKPYTPIGELKEYMAQKDWPNACAGWSRTTR